MRTPDTPITVLDEFPFTFYGDTFSVVLASNRKVYIPVIRVCEALGVDTTAQIQRIQRDEVLADTLVKLRMQVPYGDHELRLREINCIQLDKLPYWLGTIDSSRISDEVKRRQVVRFKREFAEIAWAAFRSQILPPDMRAELDASLSPEERAYLDRMDEASEIRQKLTEHGQRLDTIEGQVAGLEARLVGTDFINSAQAKQYIDMVAVLGDLLKKKRSGTHAIVHNNLKQQFQVPSYQLLPADKFPDVVKYLTRWYQSLVPAGTPLPEAFTRAEQKSLF